MNGQLILVSDYLRSDLSNKTLIESVPVFMESDKFADIVGVSHKTVKNWLDRGYIPSSKIGGRRFVNYSLLFQQSLNVELNNSVA